VEEETLVWLNKNYIGRLCNYNQLDTLKENIILWGMGCLRVRYLGDDMVLLSGIEGKKLNEVF